MKLNGFKCDDCGNIHNESSLPKGWIWLEQMIDSGKKYFHFCSIGCLRAWAIKQWRSTDVEESES